MNKRKYKLGDIADYLYEAYELVWESYKIYNDGEIRRIRKTDFYVGDRLSVMAIVRKGTNIIGSKILNVSNESLHLSGYTKEVDDWQDFLAHRHNVEDNLTK